MSLTKRKFTSPKCCTYEQYVAWVEMARMCPPPRGLGFCADCTRDYAEKMRKLGRCEHPEVTFADDEVRR